ncbi:MAG TPA: ABC transporter ATP-binding protein, partial [Actinobacteria bacterium]|nr:ABC transporter ATP-binding protein [Actinomycetota bacterium]
MSDAIVCRALNKDIAGQRVLDGFSMAAPEGRVLALLGPSGSGKTTALRLIAGFDRPDSGTIEIAGRTVVDDAGFVPPEQRRVGMVFQDFAL